MSRATSKRSRRGTVGVSLEIDAIRLAESRSGRIQRYASFSYPSDMAEGKESLACFLRQCLKEFCPHFQRMPVWVVGDLPSLHVRYMALPVVRRGSYSDMVYWTFRNEIAFDTAKTLFDYDCESRCTRGTDKVHFTAYTALRAEVDALCDLFDAARVDVTGIVIPAFAMRNFMRLQMDGQPATRLGLFVGDESSTVLVVKAGEVHASRVFKTGMHTLLAAILEQHQDITLAKAYPVLQETLREDPDGDIAHRVHAVFNRLTQQIERTMAADLAEHPDEQFDGLRVMGPIAGLPELVTSLKTSLGLPVVEANGAEDAPELAALASGAALSDLEYTPNLLRVASVRERSARQARRSVQWTLGLSVLLLLLYAGIQLLASYNDQLRVRVSSQTEQVFAFPVELQESRLDEMASRIIANRQAQKQLALRWFPVGILRGLAHATPSAIQLTSIDAVFSSDTKGTASGGKHVVELHVQGRVMDGSEHQRSKLAAYTVHLEDSPLFEKAEIVRITPVPGRSYLSFVLRLVSVSLDSHAVSQQDGGQP